MHFCVRNPNDIFLFLYKRPRYNQKNPFFKFNPFSFKSDNFDKYFYEEFFLQRKILSRKHVSFVRFRQTNYKNNKVQKLSTITKKSTKTPWSFFFTKTNWLDVVWHAKHDKLGLETVSLLVFSQKAKNAILPNTLNFIGSRHIPQRFFEKRASLGFQKIVHSILHKTAISVFLYCYSLKG